MKSSQETALVTGASGGIGLEMARILARNGVNLILVARTEGKLNALKAELEQQYKIQATVMPADLGDAAATQALIDRIQAGHLQVDYLINNAGFGDSGAYHTTDWAKTHQMLEVNIRALTQLTRAFLPAMIGRRQGRILNVSSTAAFQPGPFMAVYYATKAYVQSFSEALWEETRGTGVTVTALCPGPTESGFQAAAAIESSRLVKNQKLPTSADVAGYGYRLMMQGRRRGVHGFLNKVMAAMVPLSPKAMLLRIVRRFHDEVK